MEEKKDGRGGARKGAGRKAKKPGAGRVSFTVSCTQKQRDEVKRRAEEKRKTISAFLLDLALRED